MTSGRKLNRSCADCGAAMSNYSKYPTCKLCRCKCNICDKPHNLGRRGKITSEMCASCRWEKMAIDSYLNRFTNEDGYIMIRVPNHPYYESPYIPEHRYIMEQILGRYLEKYENVHHKNKIRNDNRPENLELWSTSQPTGARIEDLLEWANWIIHTYSSPQFPSGS